MDLRAYFYAESTIATGAFHIGHCPACSKSSRSCDTGSSPCDHVIQALEEMHSPHVLGCIWFKVARLVQELYSSTSVYIGEAVSFVIRSCIQSSVSSDFTVPQRKNRNGSVSLAVADPTVWNSLAKNGRFAGSFDCFHDASIHMFSTYDLFNCFLVAWFLLIGMFVQV